MARLRHATSGRWTQEFDVLCGVSEVGTASVSKMRWAPKAERYEAGFAVGGGSDYKEGRRRFGTMHEARRWLNENARGFSCSGGRR